MLRKVSINADDARTLEWLDSLGEKASVADRTKVIQLLQMTDSAVVRNAAALKAADLQIPKTADILIRLAESPSLMKRNGTLLYTLAQMRARVPLVLLARVLREGSYEARQHALEILSKGSVNASRDQIRLFVMMLDSFARAGNKEQQSVAEAALAVPFVKRGSVSAL
jgi:hypothetical protein